MWDPPSDGFGFPAPSNMRDETVGDDARLL
jgi:hypothetical protein